MNCCVCELGLYWKDLFSHRIDSGQFPHVFQMLSVNFRNVEPEGNALVNNVPRTPEVSLNMAVMQQVEGEAGGGG